MIKVYGSPNCPDCVAFKHNLEAHGLEFDYVDINENMPNLKAFLKLRDSEAIFEGVKAKGGVGIPAILHEDGTIQLDWEAYMTDQGLEVIPEEAPMGQACNLDGSGC